jgi:hypothetical protein
MAEPTEENVDKLHVATTPHFIVSLTQHYVPWQVKERSFKVLTSPPPPSLFPADSHSLSDLLAERGEPPAYRVLFTSTF